MYSSKSSARSAVETLESLGYVEKSGIGAFKVVKVTRDVEQLLEEKQFDEDIESDEDSSDTTNTKSSGDYVTQMV